MWQHIETHTIHIPVIEKAARLTGSMIQAVIGLTVRPDCPKHEGEEHSGLEGWDKGGMTRGHWHARTHREGTWEEERDATLPSSCQIQAWSGFLETKEVNWGERLRQIKWKILSLKQTPQQSTLKVTTDFVIHFTSITWHFAERDRIFNKIKK